MTLWNDKRTPPGVLTNGTSVGRINSAGTRFEPDYFDDLRGTQPDDMAGAIGDHINRNYSQQHTVDSLSADTGVHPDIVRQSVESLRGSGVAKMAKEPGMPERYVAHPAYAMHHGI